MRRARNIALFLAAIAIGAILYWRRAERIETPKANETTNSPPATATVQPPRMAAPPPSRDTAPTATSRTTDEPALLQQIRAWVKSDPGKAEALAREGRQRFPDSADADERDALMVDALINQQRIGAARSETYYYFDHHPGGRFTEHLFSMTGVHPTPSGPHR
jgi:hypothetical protein